MIKPAPLLRSLAPCGLLLAAALAQAAADCQRAAPETASGSAVSAGRPSLGDGMALFDARELKLAERALQSALFLGLADGQEQAQAHKYLAFIYCSNSEWLRCETAFDAAFELRPAFSLEARELEGAPWREAYWRAQAKSAQRCGQPPSGAGSSGSALPAATQQPYAFALHSAVIVGVLPLLPAAAPQAMRSGTAAAALSAEARAPGFGNNVRLRVFPWAYVQVDGKRLGVTPALTEFKLSPGAHTIELRNPGFDLVRKQVRLPQDAPVLISHDFEAR